MTLPVFCLMGPTASGKTPLAIELVQRFPCDIISVDSAMIYRDMNIGTAKPSINELEIAPHRLINILDPSETYSAGQFRIDALREIDATLANGRIPLLVGGTMMYFRVLTAGIADLPQANIALRTELEAFAKQSGWEALHALLATIDHEAALRIKPQDSQRIQRALEVYYLSGKTMTAWQAEHTNPLQGYQIHHLALMPADRMQLHARIQVRFDSMLEQGLVEEVKKLYMRDDLNIHLPSIRSVGYRHVWEYLDGEVSDLRMRENAIAATRQLAKRQLTWLRSWPDAIYFEAEAKDILEQVSLILSDKLAE